MLRCVNFLEHADGGSLIFDGKNIRSTTSAKRYRGDPSENRICISEHNLFLNKTALHNVTEGLIIGRKMPKTRAEEKRVQRLKK